MTFTSQAERKAASTLAAYPFPVIPCQHFDNDESGYTDPEGEQLNGKPDYVCRQPGVTTYIEFKPGRLNSHRSKDSCYRAMQEEYARRTGIYDRQSYDTLAQYFYRHDPGFSIDNAWNHSLFKLLSLQADKGWGEYIVMFERNPSREDAKRYLDAGLVFCSVANGPKLLATIGLAQHGICFPFVYRSTRYEFGLVPDRDSAMSLEAMQSSNRQRLLASAFAAPDTTQTF